MTADPFRQLATIVLGQDPLPVILEQVVHIASRVVDGVSDVSLTVLSDDTPATLAFTGELALALDERQYEDERGPCLDSAAAGERILVSDIGTDDRWPRYAKAATERGIGSSLSVPLPVQRELTGALNFYAPEPAAFDDQGIALAETFAGHAAVAIANAHLYESTAALAVQMKQAMESRAVIEQAKGIMMRDLKCSPDEAFDAMVRLSQRSHLKLRDLAQRLVDQARGEA